jgi:hypothetical protein
MKKLTCLAAAWKGMGELNKQVFHSPISLQAAAKEVSFSFSHLSPRSS